MKSFRRGDGEDLRQRIREVHRRLTTREGKDALKPRVNPQPCAQYLASRRRVFLGHARGGWPIRLTCSRGNGWSRERSSTTWRCPMRGTQHEITKYPVAQSLEHKSGTATLRCSRIVWLHRFAAIVEAPLSHKRWGLVTPKPRW